MAQEDPGGVRGHRNASVGSILGLTMIAALVPACLLRGALGPHRAPGLPDDGLYGLLFAGSQLRRWLLGLAAPGQADLAWDAVGFWPAHPLPALAQGLGGGLLDDGFAYGLLLAVALWLAGFAPGLLAGRQLGLRRVWVPALAALAVQLSPPVVRAAWSADFAVLGVGPLALTLAVRPRWAVVLCGLLAGGWGAGIGIATALSGALLRRPLALVALLPVIAGLALPCPELPGASSSVEDGAVVPGVVTAAGSVFPVPVGLTTGSEGTTASALSGDGVASSAGSSAWGLVARLHGGPLVVLGCLLGLAFARTRLLGCLGLAVLVALTAGTGFLPLPGVPPPEPAAWFTGGFGSLGVSGGALLALPLLAAGLGWATLVRARWPTALFVLPVLLLATPLRPLEPGLPVTNLPPEPAVEAVANLPVGPILVFPDPAEPFLQPEASLAQALYLGARTGRAVRVGRDAHPDPQLVLGLARLAGLTVDVGVAEDAWQTRGDTPAAGARAQGFVALFVDVQALEPHQLQPVRAALQGWLGPPLAEGGRYLAWKL